MVPRYTTAEMAQIWSDETRLHNWFQVEMAALAAFEKFSLVPPGTHALLEAKSPDIDWHQLSLRALEIEETTRHDVIAFLSALEETLGESSRFLHWGMTSSDVVDTAFAMSLKRAGDQLARRLGELRAVLFEQAKRHKHVLCLGRTHGQAAEPTTFGLKLLSFAVEMKRNEERLAQAISEIAHGKLSGAIGTYAHISPNVETMVMTTLGLEPERVSTQVVPRDRHSVFFATLATLAGGLERLAVEIRHLMRSEVAEAFEPFGKGQRGSSAMPHKKNPILTENVSGLARLIRSYAQAAFENQALWHERDISHSSVERVIAPDATTALDFAIARMTNVAKGLEIDAVQMRKHVDDTRGLIFSESVLLKLTQKGILRQVAYEWVQRAAMAARQGEGLFITHLKSDADISKYLTASEIDQAFDIDHHLRHVDTIFERAGAS